MCLFYKQPKILKERKIAETAYIFQISDSVFRSKHDYNCSCHIFNKALKNKNPEFSFDQSTTQKKSYDAKEPSHLTKNVQAQ